MPAWSGFSSRARIFLPRSVPPGSRVRMHFSPRSASDPARCTIWVVLPAPSPPSRVMNMAFASRIRSAPAAPFEIPLPEIVQRVVIGHVAFDRRDGYETVAQRSAVDVRVVVEGLHVRPLPVVRALAGVDALFHVLLEQGKAVAADPHPGNVLPGGVRKVHVEKRPRGEPAHGDRAHQPGDETGGGFVGVRRTGFNGGRYGRNPSQSRF